MFYSQREYINVNNHSPNSSTSTLCIFVIVYATLLLKNTSSRGFSCISNMICFANILLIINILF